MALQEALAPSPSPPTRDRGPEWSAAVSNRTAASVSRPAECREKLDRAPEQKFR